MPVESSAGPRPGNAATQWHDIDWAQVHRRVRKLQARIAKAVNEGRWRAARRLQRLLTRSFSAKALAVLRVTENRGRKTPGVDGVIWDTPEAKTDAVSALGKRDYRPQPLRRIYIPKSNGKKRPLSIPVMADRACQALHRLGLDPIAETTADPNSYGFRKARSTADAIEQCFNLLARKCAPAWVLEGDIKGCFDNFDFDWILSHIPMDRRILESWLKAGFIENQTLFPTSAGVPQGGIISPTISNMVLDGMERLLREHFPRTSSKKTRHQVHLVRYADDFIVTADTREVLEYEVRPLLEDFLQERGLELSAEKTKITRIQDGFDFLGQNIRKYGDKLLTKPSRSNQRQFRAKVNKLLGELKTAPQEMVIGKLNPVIRGWANYHRHVVSKRVFCTMDYWLWERLWRWCRRRHPKKNGHWIADRYFVREGTRGWIFQASRRVVKGKIVQRPRPDDRPYPTLLFVADTKIKRHRKVKQDANPYDPEWELYFEERITRKLKHYLRGKPRTLWVLQDGTCPECGEKLDLRRSWEVHHVVYRCHGGPDTIDNLVLLHPNCHRQLHSRDSAGRSPAGENLTRA